jgi:hypothetical protein
MHTAKNCIITCIDFRLQEKYHHWIATHHLLSASDIISISGCSRDLVKPLTAYDKAFLLTEIRTSIDLRNPKTIILLDHQDCGKYAVDQTIPSGISLQNDLAQHTKWLVSAKSVLTKEFPTESVHAYYFALTGEVTEVL